MRSPRLRRALAALLALPVALGVALLPGGSAAASSARAPQSERQVTVMTRNLYLGADLTPLVLARTPAEVNAAVATILGHVIASDPPQRMAWVADEIAARHPDAVGLQEAALWQIHLPSGATVTYDFVQLLLDALAARGLHYRVAVEQDNFDSGTQLAGAPLPARFVDRDAILVDMADTTSQLRVLATGGAHYASQLTFPTLLGPVDFERGYVWADLKTRGKQWRFADTHFEAYPGFGATPRDFTSEQAAELAAALAGPLPTVLVGDLNSSAGDPLRQGYSVLIGAGFTDAWTALRPGDPGYSCCRDDDLADGVLHERIDDVLYKGLVTPVAIDLVGVAPRRDTPPRWPSDHAGVVATLAIGKE
jgi:endonuclease/exonuclease/phosphatase family metal-dependent hydrolase